MMGFGGREMGSKGNEFLWLKEEESTTTTDRFFPFFFFFRTTITTEHSDSLREFPSCVRFGLVWFGLVRFGSF